MNVINNIEGLTVGAIAPDSIVNADCLEAMKLIPDRSIDCIICDLPFTTLPLLISERITESAGYNWKLIHFFISNKCPLFIWVGVNSMFFKFGKNKILCILAARNSKSQITTLKSQMLNHVSIQGF